MAIENIQVWPFEANWESEVRETLEWLTDVLRSPTGAEQRRALRRYPRRTLEFSVTAAGRARALFDRLMMSSGARDWYLPLWHEAHLSSAVAVLGGDFIPCPTAQSGELKVGDVIFISDGTPFRYELAAIEAISSTGITTADPLGNEWAPYSRIHPVRKARLTDQPELNRYTDTVIEATVRFSTSQINDDVIAGAPSLVSAAYRGFGALAEPPDETTRLTYNYDRLLEEFDNQVGVPYRRDTAGIAFPKQKYAWVLAGRQQNRAFRNFVYGLRGRAIPLWIPTFFSDFNLLNSPGAGSADLIVTDTGFTAAGGPSENRKDIVVEMIDGSRHFRRIVSSSVLSQDRENLVVDAPFDVGIDVTKVLRISFMTLCRLDQDNIEIVHRTDTEGVSMVNTTFRAVPNIRNPLPGI